jgi:hypothetical protein
MANPKRRKGKMANTKYEVELELTETEKKVFDEYLDVMCWLRRLRSFGS